MAVKGFNVGGAINKYDFNSLVNKEGAVTAEMLGSDVTTQLTTMSGNISTLQSQVATLNDGYTNISTRTNGTITLATGYTYTEDHSSILSKINGIVMASVSVNPPSSALPAGWTTIMTLPSGYRPIANISMPVAYYAGANAYTSSLRGVVNADGRVNVYTGSALSNVIRLQVNATFPAA